MAFTHGVLEDDSRFVIDADTRDRTYVGEKEILLVQNDHNSERCTFAIPKDVDGHDMSKCNIIRIHFVNISSEDSSNSNPGLYEVDMSEYGPIEDDASMLSFSWLIPNDATKLVGTLNFVIEFICRNSENKVEYSWHTGVYTGGIIQQGIDNSNLILSSDKYYDTLNTWLSQIAIAGQNALDQSVTRFRSEADAYAEMLKRDISEHAVDGLVVDEVIVQELGDSDRKVVSQGAITEEINGLDSKISTKNVEIRSEFNAFKTELQDFIKRVSMYAELEPDIVNEKPSITIELGKLYLLKSTYTSGSCGFGIKVASVSVERDDHGSPIVFTNSGLTIPVSANDVNNNGIDTIRFNKVDVSLNEYSEMLHDVQARFEYEINDIKRSVSLYVAQDMSAAEAEDYKVTSSTINIEGFNNAYLVKEDPFELTSYSIYPKGITNITKTNTALVDGAITHTYTILFDDGKTTTFDVKDGVGIASISKTSEDKHEDTYVIELTNGSTTEFKIPSSAAYNVLLGRISAIEKHLGIGDDADGSKLPTPINVRFLSAGFALWDEVSNAIGYKYRVYSIGGNYDAMAREQ